MKKKNVSAKSKKELHVLHREVPQSVMLGILALSIVTIGVIVLVFSDGTFDIRSSAYSAKILRPTPTVSRSCLTARNLNPSTVSTNGKNSVSTYGSKVSGGQPGTNNNLKLKTNTVPFEIRCRNSGGTVRTYDRNLSHEKTILSPVQRKSVIGGMVNVQYSTIYRCQTCQECVTNGSTAPLFSYCPVVE